MPEIIVLFGDKVVNKYIFDKDVVRIGRARDCDIVIDNLAVSRNHARLLREGGRYFAVDSRSGNGTFVNGAEIDKVQLNDNDEILIGKHKLIYKVEGADPALASDAFGGERTRLVTKAHVAYLEVVKGKQEGKEFRIDKPKTTIGRGPECDIRIDDWRVSKLHALLLRQGDDVMIENKTSWRGTTVNDKMIEKVHLYNGDVIQIGSTKLVFGFSSEVIAPSPDSAP